MRHLMPFLRRLEPLRSEGGNVAILFAVMLPVIVAGAGLGVETTYWRYRQLQLQGAADAAAYAGSIEKRAGSDEAKIEAAATVAAGQNGFDTATGVVQIGAPATAGGVATANALEVVLRTDAPRFFTAVFTPTPVPLRARSVAVFNAASAVCVLALEPSASQALLVTGSADVTLQGCNLMANSIAADAVSVQGSADLTAPCVVSVGGVAISGDVTLTSCASVQTQAPRAADPYKSLAEPTVPAACMPSNGSTLSAGRYCNGLQLNGDVTLSPGVYVIEGGDFRINANADVTGTGVTIYLKGATRLHFDGSAEVTLSPQASGDYSGILMFADRTSLGGSNVFNGTATSHLTGALYFPSQAVEYRGNFSGENGCTQVVARTVQWMGNASVGVDCSSLGMQTVPALTAVKLVE